VTARAVVVGGGFAGLAAAVALADAGVDVHVLEARPTLGGRANTFRDPVSGERIDNGQHVLAGCYDETLALLRRLGTIGLLHRPSTLHVPMIDARGRRTALQCPALPSPLNLLAGVLGWDALTLAERWAIVRVGRALRQREPPPANETVRQWLDRHRQSPRLCELLWEPLALAALNQSIDDAAAAMFVAVTSRMFGNGADAAALLIPAVPLDELYVTAAVNALGAAGCSISTNVRPRVICEDGTLAGVRIGERDVPADAVICAVPWYAVADVFAPAPRTLQPLLADAARLGASPIVTVNLWFDAWRSPEAMLGLPGRAFQWIFDRHRLLAGHQTHVSLVSSGAEAICARPNDQLIDLAVHELHQALPDSRRATVRHAGVVRERRATFSLKPGGPPRPGTATGIPRVFLAGDWIDTGLPATIESAVVSGHRAARAALSVLS
jgi:squalene-associated FAD-dependent desaturase